MKPIAAYAVLVGLPLAGVVAARYYGEATLATASAWSHVASLDFAAGAVSAPTSISLTLLLVQVSVILVTARLLGNGFRRLGQPQVVGEMAAGILLGPTLLGWVAPALSAALFPADGLELLNLLSQLGLALFMFLVGLELNPQLLRGRGRSAVVISHASIVAPFFLGSLLALFLFSRLAPAGVSFTAFALFMGTAMSVTAFPVLARILSETNLIRSRVGALTVACAAADDVSAWCLLAAVVVLVRSSASEIPFWLTLGGSLLYVAFMLLIMRRALRFLEALYCRRNAVTQDVLALVLLVVLASAAATEWLGIHALFGAFLAGAIMPKERGLVGALVEKVQDVTVVLFVPLFFALTGLRTSLALLNGPDMWLYCLAIVLAAVVGKFGGSSLAALSSGLSWRDAATLGVLMNTRGLMELVALNIGLDIGVISPSLFSMMVLMALVTTLMTSPLMARLYPLSRRAADPAMAELVPID